jgi:signal peptidase I
MGIKPSIVASGSMRPALEVGDMVLTTSVSPDAIRRGDIIQYARDGEIIIHRVIGIQDDKDAKLFITRGDSNNDVDPPVPQALVLGKTVLIIPSIGWVSIYLKMAAITVFKFFARNLATAYAVLALTVAGSIYGIHRYRNQPLRRMRRRLGR